MSSLKQLVDKHGFGIRVRAASKIYVKYPFTIISEAPDDARSFLVRYDDGRMYKVLKEFPGCNDYEVVSKEG
jgi:hypothetical protein